MSGDAFEVRAALRRFDAAGPPGYIRMGKKGDRYASVSACKLSDRQKHSCIGRKDVCLLSTGNMLPEVIEAAHS